MNGNVGDGDNPTLSRIVAQGGGSEKIIRELFQATLSRAPTEKETCDDDVARFTIRLAEGRLRGRSMGPSQQQRIRPESLRGKKTMFFERISRRDLIRCSGVALMGASASGWMRLLADEAVRQGVKKKSVVLLYMNGGASHIDTSTQAQAIRNSKRFLRRPLECTLPNICRRSPNCPKDMAVIRSMNTSEGSHARARYYIHTGYREGVGGVVHPTLGSIMAASIGEKKPELAEFREHQRRRARPWVSRSGSRPVAGE